MSLREQMREIAARPVPSTVHYDPTDTAGLMTPRPTPEPVPGTLKRKPRGPSKKTREAMEAEFQRGRRSVLEDDRGLEMLGIWVWMVICACAGATLGAWLF